ncbi:hypothetical protein BDZ88DRAFT_492372 [Geranomyces variabilis]|nr:hypothetical protein BDZ88DRAFT_492372 [Geranomyces variabilis]
MIFPPGLLNTTLANLTSLNDSPSTQLIQKRATVTYSLTCSADPLPSDSRCWPLATPYRTLSDKAYVVQSSPVFCGDASYTGLPCSQIVRQSDGKRLDQITSYGTADIFPSTSSSGCTSGTPALLLGGAILCKNSVPTFDFLVYRAGFPTIDSDCTLDASPLGTYERLTCGSASNSPFPPTVYPNPSPQTPNVPTFYEPPSDTGVPVKGVVAGVVGGAAVLAGAGYAVFDTTGAARHQCLHPMLAKRQFGGGLTSLRKRPHSSRLDHYQQGAPRDAARSPVNLAIGSSRALRVPRGHVDGQSYRRVFSFKWIEVEHLCRKDPGKFVDYCQGLNEHAPAPTTLFCLQLYGSAMRKPDLYGVATSPKMAGKPSLQVQEGTGKGPSNHWFSGTFGIELSKAFAILFGDRSHATSAAGYRADAKIFYDFSDFGVGGANDQRLNVLRANASHAPAEDILSRHQGTLVHTAPRLTAGACHPTHPLTATPRSQATARLLAFGLRGQQILGLYGEHIVVVTSWPNTGTHMTKDHKIRTPGDQRLIGATSLRPYL